MQRLKRYTVGLLITVFLIAGAIWLVLGSPLARDFRVEFTQDVLTNILGQDVIIDEDAHISFRPRPNLLIKRLRLPSENVPDEDLAVLDKVRLSLPVAAFFGRGIVLPEIEASGLVVNLSRKADGTTTWTANESDAPERREANNADIVGFLSERKVFFDNMELAYRNEETGFLFDFELTEFTVEQEPSENGLITEVRYRGLVNDQPVTFDGEFPDGAPFAASAQFGQLTAKLTGARPDGKPKGDFVSQIDLQTPDIQNFLDTLRLKDKADGIGSGTALLERENGRFFMNEIDLMVEFANGENATLSGEMNDPIYGLEFDLSFALDLVGTNPPPLPAVFLKDIRATSIDLRLVGADGNIEVDRLNVATNAFEREIRDIGPFQVKRVQRAEDGRLQLKELSFSLGPEGSPFVFAQGDVDDLLAFKEYSLLGDLDLPARAVLLSLQPETADDFGRLVGSMELKEVNGKAQLSHLVLKSQGTDLWEASVSISTDDLFESTDLKLNTQIDTPNGRGFLEALQLEPVDIGFIGLEIASLQTGKTLSLDATIAADDTVIDSETTIEILNSAPVLKSVIQSDRVEISDLQKALKALTETGRVASVYAEQQKAATDFQPLVLPEPEEKNDFQPLILPETEEANDFQPLVLPETENDARRTTAANGSKTRTDASVESEPPLVVQGGTKDLVIEDLFDLQKFIELINAEVDINIATLTGQIGINKLNARADLKNGRARIGPVEMSYQSGAAAVYAEADLANAPQWLRLYGKTGSWDFGRTLAEAGVDIGAEGILDGTFDVTGRHGSAEEFILSMTGKATLNMRDGRIESSLIELAGLGILPWLFSQELAQGFTRIVCLRAPITAKNGTLSTADTVLETPRVQLVGAGSINLKNNSINFRAEPRPVGRPLARTPWPFEVTGPLSSPNVDIVRSGRRDPRTPLSMPDQRTPCVPDKQQLQSK